jgi:tRNA(fMet)-specific endonuclease VapC
VRDPSFGCSAGGRLAVLIDTDLLIEWGRGETAATFEVLIGDEERALSVITVSELLHGVYRATGARRTRRRAFVEHILAEFDPLPITETVARAHADVWADLERRGDPVGAHDLWIAATALTHGFGVASGNRREFERIPGLRVVAPG